MPPSAPQVPPARLVTPEPSVSVVPAGADHVPALVQVPDAKRLCADFK